MKTLYYDCFSGISGDMNLGAMIDVGVPAAHLLGELNKLGVSEEFDLLIEKTVKDGIAGTKVTVVDRFHAPSLVAHDHGADHTHVHHHVHEHDGYVHEHVHSHEHDHSHEDWEDHSHGHQVDHAHQHQDSEAHGRTFKDIKDMIMNSALSPETKELAVRIFEEVARAESRIHGKPMEAVHFHEVGAIDSIVDIVGAAICLVYLKVDQVIVSPVEVGKGLVQCAHGWLPVPAPATAEILKGVPIRAQWVDFEATTPTGAAIIRAVATHFTTNRKCIIREIGYGLGHKHNPHMPNVLRVWLGETEEVATPKEFVVEANIDDMSAEAYELLVERLLEAGVDDVYMTPILMKKERPATKVTVLCPQALLGKAKEILFHNSTTIGVRQFEVERERLERKEVLVSCKYGEVPVKVSYYHGEAIQMKPEYEYCKKIAMDANVSLQEVQEEVRHAYRRLGL